MCNTGVNAAIGENIVLLDDDRILPHNWFTKQLTLLRQGSVISAHRLYRLNFSCSDEQIDFVPKLKDFRIADMGTIGDNLGAKTVFSGNAVMKKDDYLDLGSMDESFVGYGYSDTDFSYKTWKAGLKIILANDDELHLWHSLDINLEEFNKSNFDNALKFCKKWEIVPSVHWKALWKRYHGLNI
jgi:GT2 family glycosyltransferase